MLVAAFSSSPLLNEFESKAPLQINFALRQALHLDPQINPKLKILVFDDAAVHVFKRVAPNLGDWQAIFTHLSSYRPRAILIDKMFDMPEPKADDVGFVKALSELPTPVVIGAFIVPGKINGRKPLELSQPFSQIPPIMAEGGLEDLDRLYPWLKEFPNTPYGAPSNIIDAFKGVGHITYRGYFMPPIFRFSDGRMLPHITLFATGGPKLRGGKLYINDVPVPLTPDGLILINFIQETALKPVTFSLAPLGVAEAKAELPIKEDDVVLILPSMYTGHADWQRSPTGDVPGGMFLASMLNSSLEKRWLHVLPAAGWMVVAAGIIGGAIALIGSGALTFWLVIVSCVVIVAGLGFWLFAVVYWVIPWFSMIIAVFITGLSTFAVRARLSEREHFRLKQELATAKIVQTQLFPPEKVKLQTLQVIAKSEPAAECGGDFWNHFETTDGRQYILIGDAVGHGMPAALVAASTHATAMTIAEVFKSAPLDLLSPAYVLSHINSVLVTSFKSEITMTLFVAEFDMKQRKVRFANAGHCQPFLLNPKAASGDGYQLLKSRGDPLGIDKRTTYNDSSLGLAEGARLHFYTDGLVECRDQAGKILGAKKFTEHFRKSIALTAESAIKGIFDLVREYSKAFTLEDDGTIVIVEADVVS